MLKKAKQLWTELDRTISVNQRELVLGAAVCALSGIVLGVFLSPKKTTTIGSNNGSNNSGNTATAPALPNQAEIDEKAESEKEA